MKEVKIRLHIEEVEGGFFCATSKDVPGLVAQGHTIEETVEIARDVARKIVEVCQQHGDPLPPVFETAVEREADFTVPVEVP